MRTAYFDIEGDGLLDTITKVHCLSIQLSSGPEVFRYVGDQVPAGLALLDECDEIVAHNGIGFDAMALWQVLLRWKPKAKLIDSMILSMLVHADMVGGHGLEDWGARVGEPKMDYKAAFITWKANQSVTSYTYTEGDEWLEYNPVMGDYCDQDVRVLRKVYIQLRKDMDGWDWSKSEWMEHEFAKVFARQGWRGVQVDVPHVTSLYAKLTTEAAEIEALVEPLLPPKPGTKAQLSEVTPPKIQFKKNGEPSAAALKWFDELRHQDGMAWEGLAEWQGRWRGEWHKLPTPADAEGNRLPLTTEFPMKLSDTPHLKTWLMDMGWMPTMWSYKKAPDKRGKLRVVRGDDGQPIPTQPKFHDKGVLCENLEIIKSEFEHVAGVVKWMILRHRAGFCKGVIEALRPDGTVGATGFALGTPTSRVAHTKPVANAPKADAAVLYGKEIRQCFTARKRRVFVGVDASGLELRCLAARIGTDAMINMIVSGKKEDGTEIHSFNAKLLGCSREVAKTAVYAFLYGSGDAKLGAVLGGDAKRGEQARALLIKGVPGLLDLMKKVDEASLRGWIKGLDGRKIEIRSKHAALNMLLQSDGSILVKWATVYMNQRIAELRLDAYQVIHYHDEVQLDAHPAHAKQAGELFVEGLKWAGAKFNYACPLDGEVKIGLNWAETH